MTAQPVTLPQPATTTHRAPLLPALAQLTLAEMRKLLRNPMFAVGTIGFPILFFALFGLPNVHDTTPDGTPLGPYMTVSFGATALLSLAIFSFGVGIAVERTSGWMRLLRSSPLPAPLYFAAKIIAALLFSALALILLYAFAHFVGGVTIPLGVALTALGKLLLGMIPLVAMGLAIGFLVNFNAANVVAQIINLLMAFGSGLYMPLFLLPKFVQKAAPFLPAYHLGVVGRSPLVPTPDEGKSWLALAAFTLFFGALAVWGWKKDESREG